MDYDQDSFVIIGCFDDDLEEFKHFGPQVSKATTKKKTRSSKYKGVSKNGLMWQVQIGSVSTKRYMGRFENEIEAAQYYDKQKILQKGF
eukprot:CAMPEP_0176355488 /NCGR_PEP_ID=MMETSP0126-20121128/13323_1 /TAXON_ID=141414 ORGANISM="Strombidinopsis acuminatum, Strain SPMC142" /NCGR_SAMPLE_ID=MMETSP0126 /ASSEMBLY_ACC=CAM_ASM_000229 /LENGTH=88 /DNA_ID=CAMNT_0017708145 /DNA_START=777 /DNA_END=1043 /DNA_ORIENTATION=-